MHPAAARYRAVIRDRQAGRSAFGPVPAVPLIIYDNGRDLVAAKMSANVLVCSASC